MNGVLQLSNSKKYSDSSKCLFLSDSSKYSAFIVVHRHNDNAIFITQPCTFENFYHNPLIPVFKKAIKNFLNTRKHLALQLDFECKNISEEYFLEEQDKCLFESEKIPFDELKEEVDLLFRYSDIALDAEEVSNILNCPIDDAEKAINKLYIGV
jgi:hypothetical protein